VIHRTGHLERYTALKLEHLVDSADEENVPVSELATCSFTLMGSLPTHPRS
jgi:hypothetical protein